MRLKSFMLGMAIAGVTTGLILLLAWLVAGCIPRNTVAPSSTGPAELCRVEVKKIYFGSCGDKMIKSQAKASCVLCQGIRGCLAFPGTYCVGDFGCDDSRCE